MDILPIFTNSGQWLLPKVTSGMVDFTAFKSRTVSAFQPEEVWAEINPP
jgi:hypothetical protein